MLSVVRFICICHAHQYLNNYDDDYNIIMNISNYTLTEVEANILTLGLTIDNTNVSNADTNIANEQIPFVRRKLVTKTNNKQPFTLI